MVNYRPYLHEQYLNSYSVTALIGGCLRPRPEVYVHSTSSGSGLNFVARDSAQLYSLSLTREHYIMRFCGFSSSVPNHISQQ